MTVTFLAGMRAPQDRLSRLRNATFGIVSREVGASALPLLFSWAALMARPRCLRIIPAAMKYLTRSIAAVLVLYAGAVAAPPFGQSMPSFLDELAP